MEMEKWIKNGGYKIDVFEKNVFRSIFGGVKEIGKDVIILEFIESLKSSILLKVLKLKGWTGYLVLDILNGWEKNTVKKVFVAKSSLDGKKEDQTMVV